MGERAIGRLSADSVLSTHTHTQPETARHALFERATSTLDRHPRNVPANVEPRSVAIVHDYLNQCGGAERVALELARMWPGAPVYTSLHRARSTFPEFEGLEVRTSLLDRLPVDRGFRALAPLYPAAFRALGPIDSELVVSSSSGWAHGVPTTPDALHIVYCHTPPRWLYRADEHLGRSIGRSMLAPLTGPLRRWDKAAAARADLYVANCENVRRRIREAYGRDALVVHPPVNVERFAPRPRGERLLVVSRLLPYKRVELIVRAAARTGLGLDIVGVGPSERALRREAGPKTVFHGLVDDDAMVQLMEGCRALCLAGTEDFGITPVEALAAGKPVVAYAAGGVLETLQDGVNAALFRELEVEAVVEAIARADALASSPAELARGARRFSAIAFRTRFRKVARDALKRRRLGSGPARA